MKNMQNFLSLIFIISVGILLGQNSKSVLTGNDLLRLKTCENPAISPNGKWIAYTVSVPREPDDLPGSSYSELYLVSTETGLIKPFITGHINISDPQWRPDGKMISFRAKKGDEKYTQVWGIPVDGGESTRLTSAENTVESFRWHPEENKIAYIAEEPKTKREIRLKEKGYDFIFYEENLKHKNIYLVDLDNTSTKQLTSDLTVWDFEFNYDGTRIAASVSPNNLIDEKYMERRLYLLDLKTGEFNKLTDNQGKIGNYKFNSAGTHLVYAAALERKDHQISQVFVTDLSDETTINLTPEMFKGHITWVGWYDELTVLYRAGEGVWSTYSTISVDGGKRNKILDSKETGVIYESMTRSNDGKNYAFTGSTPTIVKEVFFWNGEGKPRQMTDVNPWLKDRLLGEQKVITYNARDNQPIEGLLIYPVGYSSAQRYPLVVYVHGGPEHHHYFEWCSRYSEPGQVLAGMEYLVFYPNYRSSTGYGLPFALAGFEDPAGVEFDDIADGIDHLIETGLADADKVGLAGGSYGGYAAAWFATFYTEKVKAVSMFVGISDLTSKRGSTDIPYEELYVHSGKKLEEMWDLSLRRSPLYYAHQSKTAVLILGGTDDTRVHPSQSLEMYRRLKMNNHPAVRLVQYPGEKHGNSKQTSRKDLLFRQIGWFEWYLGNGNPINGPMPPLDISDKYGLDME